jgi:hypothetical protein
MIRTVIEESMMEEVPPGYAFVYQESLPREFVFQYKTGQTSYLNFIIIIVGRPKTFKRIQKT